ncbi:hypothetical protein [Bifidobacterium reuteri]|uniref:hypothetical protein n=1 Tax=Bifidobacterium reuteri TaxID=983706 RepID=UPI0005C56A79|nr:hypothetical protein [Bifidobacterium reuteri]
MQNDEHGQGDEALPYPVIGEAAGDHSQGVEGPVRAFDSGDSVGMPAAADVTGAGASADAASAALTMTKHRWLAIRGRFRWPIMALM